MQPELKRWCDASEQNNVLLGNEYFNMQVGLKYSEKKIGELEKKNEKISVNFLKNFKEPKEVYNACIGTVAGSKTYKLMLQLHELRKTKIKSEKYKFSNQPVCWTNWRQFSATANDKSRKEVFDEFVRLTPEISQVIKKKFELSAKIYESYGTNPLKEYLEEHKISLEHLKKVLLELRDGLKDKFSEEFSHYSNKFLKREPRYYDDFYFIRNIVYHDLIDGFGKINGLEECKKVMRNLGLNPDKIKIDDKDRPKKYPSPFASFIKIPTDIRVSYKMENPLNTTTAIYHEMGHAIHASHIKKELSYWKKYLLSNGLAESFSIFFESLLLNKNYLTKKLKLSNNFADEFIARTKFIETYSIAFYTGNSLFRIKYWEDKMNFEDCNKEYSKQLKESVNMNIPGAYWQLHHILPESLMYVPSYMLAMIKAREMHQHLEKEYGMNWWQNKKSGEYILGLMEPGADSANADFEKINTKEFIKWIKN